MNAINIHDDLALPFVNDEEVVGKWEIVGEYAEKSDLFMANLTESYKSSIIIVYINKLF